MDIADILKQAKAGELDEDTLVRAVVAYPDWQVAANPDGCALLWDFGGVSYACALAKPDGPYGKTYQYMPMRGRHLIRHLPDDVGGVAFQLGQPEATGWERADWGPLIDVADSLDLEDAHANAEVGEADRIRQYAWYFLCQQGRPEVLDFRGKRVIVMFSASDLARRFLAREPQYQHLDLFQATGAELFGVLVERDDYDGVWLNPYAEREWEPVGPGCVVDWHEGREPRPDVQVLQLRSVADIHQFLDLETMSREGRRHQLVHHEGQLVALYEGTMIGRSARSYRVEPVAPLAHPLDFGEGRAEWWCMGKIADLVRRRLRDIPTFGDWTVAEIHDHMAGMLRWIDELEKWLSSDLDVLPRRSFRSVDGARFVREYPEIATRAWLRQAKQQGLAHL